MGWLVARHFTTLPGELLMWAIFFTVGYIARWGQEVHKP